MRVVITDTAAIAAIWSAAGQTDPAPTSVTVTTAKAQELRLCECGCGGQTANHWVPGHDAKHKSRLFALVRGTDEAQAKAARKELTTRGWPLPAAKAAPAPLPLATS